MQLNHSNCNSTTHEHSSPDLYYHALTSDMYSAATDGSSPSRYHMPGYCTSTASGTPISPGQTHIPRVTASEGTVVTVTSRIAPTPSSSIISGESGVTSDSSVLQQSGLSTHGTPFHGYGHIHAESIPLSRFLNQEKDEPWSPTCLKSNRQLDYATRDGPVDEMAPFIAFNRTPEPGPASPTPLETLVELDLENTSSPSLHQLGCISGPRPDSTGLGMASYYLTGLLDLQDPQRWAEYDDLPCRRR